MSSPNKITFDLEVANKLSDQCIFVKVDAERQYIEQRSSSSYNHHFADIKNIHSSNKSHGGSRYNKQDRSSSNYNNNKSHNKSQSSSSNSSSRSSSTSVNVSGSLSYGGASVSNSVGVDHSNSNQSSSSNHHSDDNLQHNIYSRNRRDLDENARSDYKSDSYYNDESKQFMNNNQSSSAAILTNKIIDTGFVQIGAGQTLPFPTTVQSVSPMVYITIYYNNNYNIKTFLCNSYAFNQHYVEIKYNDNYNTPIIQVPTGDDCGDFRKLLKKWKIPQHLISKMQEMGWIDIDDWESIKEQNLIAMGFHEPERLRFQRKYKQYVESKRPPPKKHSKIKPLKQSKITPCTRKITPYTKKIDPNQFKFDCVKNKYVKRSGRKIIHVTTPHVPTNDRSYETVLFGERISGDICKKYTIFFKINCPNWPGIFIGYVPSKNDFKGPSHKIGSGDSVSLNIHKNDNIYVWHKESDSNFPVKTSPEYYGWYNQQQWSLFTFEIDFVARSCCLSIKYEEKQKYIKIMSIDLETKSLIPAFSLYTGAYPSKIEIIECKLE